MSEHAQPEQQFFPDPAVDRVMGVLFNLMGEVQVLRERVQVLEHALAEQGVVAAERLDRGDLPADLAARLAADRAEYVRNCLEPVLGRAASRNDPEAERARA